MKKISIFWFKMSLTKAEKNLDKTEDKGIILPNALYVISHFYDKSDLITYLENVLLFLLDSEEYSKFFPEGEQLLSTIRIQSSPLSLIVLEKLDETTKKLSKLDFVRERSVFEADCLLQTKYIPEPGNNFEDLHSNDRKREMLINLFQQKLAPKSFEKNSNKLFKVLSGRTYLICDNIHFIRVLKGQYPDGTVKRERQYKNGFTEEDVLIRRRELQLEKSRILDVLNVNFLYLKPKLEDLKEIFFSMCFSKDHPQELFDFFSTVFFYCLDLVNILLEGFIKTKNDENNETEQFTIAINGLKTEKSRQMFKRILDVSIPLIEDDIEKIKSLNLEICFRNNDFINHLLIAIMRSRLEELDSTFEEKISNRTKDDFEIVLSSNIEIMNEFRNCFPSNNRSKFEINSDFASRFNRTGEETIKSYTNRYFAFAESKDEDKDIHLAAAEFLKTSLTSFILPERYRLEFELKKSETLRLTKLDPRNVMVNGVLRTINFNITGFYELLSIICGTQITAKHNSIVELVETLFESNKVYEETLQFIEDELDKTFGDSKIVRAVDIPELILSETSKTNRWITNICSYIKYQTKKIVTDNFKLYSYREYQRVFQDFLTDFDNGLSEECFEINKEGESFIRSNIYKTFSTINLITFCQLLQKYKERNGEVKIQPDFQDFKIKNSDLTNIGRFMRFKIKKCSVIIGKMSYKVSDLFYMDKTKIDERQVVDQTGRARLISHFKELFSNFSYSGGEILVDLFEESEKIDDKIEYQIVLQVNFSTESDTFICSKFYTRGFTSKVEDILDYEEVADEDQIKDSYILHFDKTGNQLLQLSGHENSKTFELYEVSPGCRELYPFTTNINISKITNEVQSLFSKKITPRVYDGASNTIQTEDEMIPFDGTAINEFWSKKTAKTREEYASLSDKKEIEHTNDILQRYASRIEMRKQNSRFKKPFEKKTGDSISSDPHSKDRRSSYKNTNLNKGRNYIDQRKQRKQRSNSFDKRSKDGRSSKDERSSKKSGYISETGYNSENGYVSETAKYKHFKKNDDKKSFEIPTEKRKIHKTEDKKVSKTNIYSDLDTEGSDDEIVVIPKIIIPKKEEIKIDVSEVENEEDFKDFVVPKRKIKHSKLAAKTENTSLEDFEVPKKRQIHRSTTPLTNVSSPKSESSAKSPKSENSAKSPHQKWNNKSYTFGVSEGEEIIIHKPKPHSLSRFVDNSIDSGEQFSKKHSKSKNQSSEKQKPKGFKIEHSDSEKEIDLDEF